jgi:ribose 5-phosphate isomerase A
MSQLQQKESVVKHILQILETECPQSVSLGGGSTIQMLCGKLIELEHQPEVIICGSRNIEKSCLDGGLSIYPYQYVEMAIDGADKILHSGRLMIKGGGGALWKEKILLYSSQIRYIIVDATKLEIVEKILVPVEISSFGSIYVKDCLELILDMYGGKLTDKRNYSENNNLIVEMALPNMDLDKWINLEIHLKSLPGVIETGIFIDLADKIFVGNEDGVEVITLDTEKNDE